MACNCSKRSNSQMEPHSSKIFYRVIQHKQDKGKRSFQMEIYYFGQTYVDPLAASCGGSIWHFNKKWGHGTIMVKNFIEILTKCFTQRKLIKILYFYLKWSKQYQTCHITEQYAANSISINFIFSDIENTRTFFRKYILQ